MGKKTHRNSNSVPKRLMVRGLKLVIFIGIPVLIFGFTFRLKNVTVTGTTRYTEEQITEQLVRTELDYNTLMLYLKYHYFKDVRIPFVEKVDLELKDMNSVNIRVYEKMVTGCIQFMGEYLYFDKDGIIVESSSEQLEDIPLIKGLEFDKIILNEKLEVQKDELFDVILNLTQLIDKFGLDVKTIRFDKDYSVMVDCGDISARLGKRSTYDEVLAELKNIIQGSQGELNEVLNKSGGAGLELDMTNYGKGTKPIVATPKKTSD
jgi:cell division protein FtsQ